MSYRNFIFSDVDGTLANSLHKPDLAQRPYIEKIQAADLGLVLVSARSPSGLLPFYRELNFSGPTISYSGAYVLDDKKNCLRSITFDAAQIISELKELSIDVSVNLYRDDTWYVNEIDERVAHEADIVEVTPLLTDLAELSKELSAHKLLLMGDAEAILAAQEALKPRYPELAIVRSNEYLLEIMGRRSTKSSAALLVCQHYGIDPEEALAFGDGENDVDLLSAFKRSFAPKNACAQAKAAASKVSELTNDELMVVKNVFCEFALDL